MFAKSRSWPTSPGFSAPSPSSGAAFRPITSEVRTCMGHWCSCLCAPLPLRIPPLACLLQQTSTPGLSSAYSSPFSVKCHKITVIWDSSGERVSCPGNPQATQPLARGYGEGNLLFKENREQPCTKNSGCADSEAGRSSTLSSMGSWPTRWLSAPFPGAVERHQELGSCLGALPAADPRVCPAKCPHCHLRFRCQNLGFFANRTFPGCWSPFCKPL